MGWSRLLFVRQVCQSAEADYRADRVLATVTPLPECAGMSLEE